MTLDEINAEISGVYAEIEDLLSRFREEYLEESLDDIDFSRMFADMDFRLRPPYNKCIQFWTTPDGFIPNKG